MPETEGVAGSPDVRTLVGGRTLSLTNLDKVLFPAVGYTKAEVIAYYAGIAETLLPHLQDRALTRIRYPDGVGEDRSFYEKNAPKGTPEWVRTAAVLTSDGLVDYVVAEEPATVVWLANLAALELHVPQWTLSSATPDAEGVIQLPEAAPRPGEPLANRVVVDLDPGAGMTLVECARAALMVAALLAADGMVPVPQTSGSKGMQVYAAVQPCRSADATAYVRQLARLVKKQQPDLFVLTMSVAQRAGHIYVDHLQNIAAKNTVSPYSLRGRERPGVATPLSWEEVAAITTPDDLRFTPEQVLERVAEHGDLAADLITEHAPPLPIADPADG